MTYKNLRRRRDFTPSPQPLYFIDNQQLIHPLIIYNIPNGTLLTQF